MSFTIENEKQKRVFFHDVETILKDRELIKSVYSKSTFTGVYTYFESVGKFFTLGHKCFQICPSWVKLYTKLLFSKYILLRIH